MADKALLNEKASKVLQSYSQARGLTPSQAVIRLVETAKPDEADLAFERLLDRPTSKLSDKTVNKLAVAAVNRQRKG
jgi:hypothetical protein